MSYQVHLWPIEKNIIVEENETVLKACQKAKIPIRSECGGVANCVNCIARIMSGEDYLSPMEFSEIKLLGNVFHITRERLLCQLKVTGPVSIDISDHLGKEEREKLVKPSKTVIRKRKEQEEIRAQKEEAYQERLKLKEQNKKLGGGKRPRRFSYSEES